MPCTHDFCLILPPSPWPSSLSQRLLTYYTAPASLNPFPILPPESPQDRRLPPRNTSTHACKRWLGICSKYYQIIITCEGGYLGGASHPPTRKKPSEDQTLASNCTPPPVIFIRGSCSGVLDAWRSGSLEGKVQSIIFVPAVFFPDAHHLEQLLFCHCKRGFVPSRLLRRRRHQGKRAPVTDVTDKPAAGVFCCRFWWFLVG